MLSAKVASQRSSDIVTIGSNSVFALMPPTMLMTISTWPSAARAAATTTAASAAWVMSARSATSLAPAASSGSITAADFREPGGGDVGDNERGAFAGETLCDGTPHGAAGTGNEGGTPLQSHGLWSPAVPAILPRHDPLQLVDGLGINQGGQISGLLVEQHGADHPAHGFHVAGARKVAHKENLFWPERAAEAADDGVGQNGCEGIPGRLCGAAMTVQMIADPLTGSGTATAAASLTWCVASSSDSIRPGRYACRRS